MADLRTNSPTSLPAGWQTIGEQRDFYDERDCLDPSHDLASDKLKTRNENDVVIFDYSLSPDYLNRTSGSPPVEEGGSSPGHPSADNAVFFQVSKNDLIKSEHFDQIINSPPLLSRGARLGIIDFPQCYDTYDDELLNSVGEKLGLPKDGETTFMDAHLQRARALPGRGRFKTGVSLRAPPGEPSELSRPGSSETRFILFVSFPYFGGPRKEITLGLESESVELLDFKRMEAGAPDRRAAVNEEEGGNMGKLLVHQARYMIFDNYTMATFRSKEDGAKDQVPLHRFQERIGAFRAMVHMIANRTGQELWTLKELQKSLCKLDDQEEDIGQVISDAEIYGDGQGRERKQKGVRDIIAALHRFSADLSAATSVAKRQIAVLQDLHSVFSTSYRTKTKDYEKGYPLRRNPFHRNVAPVPILLENPEQIWPNTLDTIDEFSTFLKSDQAKAAPSEKTAQETAGAAKRTEDAVRETTAAIALTRTELMHQGQILSGFTIVTTAFLALGFSTSYFGMNNIKEFSGASNLRSLLNFWLTTAPILAGVLLLTTVAVLWKRKSAIEFRSWAWEKLRQWSQYRTDNTNTAASQAENGQIIMTSSLGSSPTVPQPQESAHSLSLPSWRGPNGEQSSSSLLSVPERSDTHASYSRGGNRRLRTRSPNSALRPREQRWQPLTSQNLGEESGGWLMTLITMQYGKYHD
ncbi:hypothetical protein B9Z19DRAFT_1061381 [Tuber borchii]|uniref:Uncharacterized protein n=1 Tax=Tuber borchii TaxID=42251 RepID=A0A2T7A5D5_TUBBO|nr:hypothetical protein B9Z19DRAFT_1061381 [Tuber borchii]